MAETFVVEDSRGRIMKSDGSPAVSTSVRSEKSTKKSSSKKPGIKFLESLSEKEEDPLWVREFEILSIKKHPTIRVENRDNETTEIKLIVNIRKFKDEINIPKEGQIIKETGEEVTRAYQVSIIKDFIKKYSDVSAKNKEEDKIYVDLDPKRDIFPWNNLTAVERFRQLRSFAEKEKSRYNLSSSSYKSLLIALVVANSSGNMGDYIKYDDNEDIIKVANLNKSSDTDMYTFKW